MVGVAGFSGADTDESAYAKGLRSPDVEHPLDRYLARYRYLPYTLRNGQEQVLSRWNMVDRKPTVSRQQSKVKVAADGSALLISCGKGPTMWRSAAEWSGPWNPLYKDECRLLTDGDQVSLDCNDPEAAFFACQVQYAQQDETPQGYAQGLPAGWISGVDEVSGVTYYYNEQTGESQWEWPQ